MKRILVVLGMAAALLVAASPPAQAAVEVNEVVPIEPFFVDVPCANGGAGETLSLEGRLHVLITFVINGNNVSGKTHFQPQGVTGTGLTTGDTYHATGVTQDHFKSSLQNGQSNLTFVNNFRIIGPGPGNNLLIHDVFHVTINANGDVTVEHSITNVECM